MDCFTAKETAKKLSLSLSAFYSRIYRSGILPVKVIKGVNYYYLSQFEKVVEKYYPMKTTETFYIYESKMNTL